MRIHIGILNCLLPMLIVAAAAFAWWGATWGTVLLAIGVGCLAALLYSWMTARRIDRQLDRVKRQVQKK